jgi:hypothetical protein
MILNVIALVLVLAITFMHSIFGFFSGLINVFCSVVSVTVALGFYEALNDLITAQIGLHPGYTEPACLVGLFLVAFIATRTLADNYVRRGVRLPAGLDWAGGAVFGLINAQFLVGIAVLGVLMLPLRDPETGAVLGFARFQRNPDEQNYDHPELTAFTQNHLWTRPDEFTVYVFNRISGGSFRGKAAFAEVYPDFTEAVFFSTNTVQPQSTPSPYRDRKTGDGFELGLEVEEWWEETGPIEGRYRSERPTEREPNPDYERVTFEPASGYKLIATKLVLNRAAADRARGTGLHLFRPTMLRLVGEARGEPAHEVPRVIANADPRIGGAHRVVDYDNNFSVPAAGNVRIYAYFEVDQDFTPEFVEYRRHARAPMSAASRVEAADVRLTLAGRTDEGDAGRRGRGRGAGLTFGRVLESDSGDNARLPFPMRRDALRRAGSDVTVDGDMLVSGRVFGARSRLSHSGTDPRVNEFKVPEGYRLLQICYKPKEARTLVGDVFNYVGQLNQYIAVDSSAEHHRLAGYYAIIHRRDDEYIELFFTGDPDSPMAVSYNHMLDFRSLERNEINDQEDSEIGLLFLVPPGAKIVRVQNQKGEGGDVNITMRR